MTTGQKLADDQDATTIPLHPNGRKHFIPNENNIEILEDPKYCFGSYNGPLSQCLVTLAVILAITSCSLPIGYSAILLPQLEMDNSTLSVTDEMGSWIASIHSTATPIGAFLSGFLMDRFGRKHAVQIAVVPLIIGWLLIALSQNMVMMLCGRFTAGLSIGFAAAPSQVIIGEMSEPHLRGIFSTTPIVGYALGVLLVYAMGSYFHWRTVALLSTILPAVTIIAFIFLPDTPTWLLRKGRVEEGAKALFWLRKNNVKTHKELHQLMSKISDDKNENNNHEKSTPADPAPNTPFYKNLVEPHVLKPLIILFVFALLQIFSGTYVLIFHAVVIVKQMGNFDIDSFSIAILTAVIRLICTAISIILIAVIGRRPLALLSSITGGVCALFLGIFLTVRNTSPVNSWDISITVIFLIIYVAGNTVGIMPMFGTLISELAPARVRGLIGGFIFSFNNIGLFLFIKFFPFVKNTLGIPGIFILFGSSSLIGAVIIYLILPETKNRSLIEIEDYFRHNKLLWVRRHRDFRQKSDIS